MQQPHQLNSVIEHAIGRSRPCFADDVSSHEEQLREKISQSRVLLIGGAGTIGQAVAIELFKRDPLDHRRPPGTGGRQIPFRTSSSSPPGPFLLGGNCQGSLVAIEMARRLRKQGTPPLKLILMEWGFQTTPYDGETIFLYGDQSPIRNIYKTEHTAGHPWQQQFPHATTHSLPSGHGDFFEGDAVHMLADILRDQCHESIFKRAVRRLLARMAP